MPAPVQIKLSILILPLVLYFISGVKAQCDATCLTCQLAVSKYHCLTCNDTLNRVLNGVFPAMCICKPGYVQSNSTCVLNLCNYRCPGLCQMTSTNCTSCTPNSNRYLLNNQCLCSEGYYDNGLLICQSCSQQCKTCVGLNTNCTNCQATLFRGLNGSTCKCLTGYFDDGVLLCQKCSYKCLRCQVAANNCTTCSDTTRTLAPTCDCIAKYFDDGSIKCPSCHYSCSTCTNASMCLTCNSTKRRQLSSETGRCSCMVRFFDNATSNQDCSACHPTCYTCLGTLANNCLSCFPLSFRILDSTKSCVCKTGYYQVNSTTQLCEKCHQTCYQCNGPSSTNCIKCNLALQLELVNNQCMCSQGYYKNSTGSCVICDFSCISCTSDTNCTVCRFTSQIINQATGLCVCPSGRYLDISLATPSCALCNPICLTCLSQPTMCESCNTTHNRVIVGTKCLCAIRFYDDGVNICKSCHFTCLTCNSTGCLSCNTGVQRIKNGTTCQCASGYYDDFVNQNCIACYYSCSTCVTTSTNCLTCDNTVRFRQLSQNTCVCIAGYYDSGNPICQKCINRCVTCVNSSSACLSCAGESSTRNLTAPQCGCLDKFYDDGFSANCLACHYTCKTCTTPIGCFSCDFTKYRVYNTVTKLCKCIIRYYDENTELCTACHPTCLTCIGSAPNNCLSCNPVSKRSYNSQTKTCDCVISYWQTSTTVELCEACHPTCLTCSGSSQTECLSCNLNQKFLHNPTTKVCTCMVGYYLNSIYKCLQCFPTCASCTGYPQCTSCKIQNQVINPNTGVCECTASTAWDPVTSSCTTCHYTCKSCELLSTNCTSCEITKFRTKVINTCSCVPGYYENGNDFCQICHFKCLTCNSSSQCLTCDANLYRVLNGSSCICNSGFYDDNINALCLPCHYSCKTCTSPTACTSCNTVTANRRLNSVTMLCDCIVKFFQNPNTKTCQACPYHCSTCLSAAGCQTCNIIKKRVFNETSKFCQCQTGTIDDGLSEQCRTCLYDCLTCVDLYTCTTCNSELHFRELSDVTKRCVCIVKYYQSALMNSPICLPCHYTCSSCTNSSSCLTCDTSKNRVFSQGQCKCRQSYFDDGSNQLCLGCHFSCKTCTLPSACSSCSTTSLRTLAGTSCVCQLLNYYDNGEVQNCQPCHYTCNTCTNNLSCDSCNTTNYFRTPNDQNSLCKCLNGYFDDGLSNQLCKPCPYSCLTCDNPNSCLTCDTNNHFRTQPELKCKCLDGYFNNNQNPVCSRCHYTCKTCIAANQCINCNIFKFREFDVTNSLCKCISGYYDTSGNQVCQKCHYSCKTCTVSASNCTTCETTNFRTFNSSTKSCVCNLGFYDNSTDPMCQPCHYSCLSCSTASTCNTCDPSKFRMLDSVTGRCICRDGFYDDSFNNQVCVACERSCLKCRDGGSCSECDSTKKRVKNNTADYNSIVNPYCSCFYKHFPQPDVRLSCLSCHYSCAACSNSLMTSCLFCTKDARRVMNVAMRRCLCEDGYYDNGLDQLCVPCHSSCLKCTNGTTTSCTLCAAGFYLKIDDTTCYQVCPTKTFAQNSTRTCQYCEFGCTTCVNNTTCLACELDRKLYQSNCLAQCPSNTYVNNTINKCEDCPSGCLTCENSIKCYTCYDGFFLNTMLSICPACHLNCKKCFGQSINQCTDCESPLVLQGTQCKILTCLDGFYVDPRQGCVQCSKKFPNATSCNFTHPTLCIELFKVNVDRCDFCTNVRGYVLTPEGKCLQICGDGKALTSQCDDGNNMKGDGCSQYCIIQEGWICQKNINQKSICYLDGQLKLGTGASQKVPGQNSFYMQKQLSAPVAINTKQVKLTVKNSTSATPIKYAATQDPNNMKKILINVTYAEDMQKKNIQLSYNSTTSTQRNLLEYAQTVNQIFMVEQFQVYVYPPAVFFEDSKLLQMKLLRATLYVSCVFLLAVCAVNLIFVKKIHVHLFTVTCIPANFYILYGLLSQKYTDWIKWSLKGLQPFAFIGGFKMNNFKQMQKTSFLDYSSSIQRSAGCAIGIMVVLWAFYGFLMFLQRFFMQKNKTLVKAMMFSRYYILSFQLILSPHLTYCQYVAFYNASLISSQGTALNICYSLALIIYSLAILIILFLMTKKLTPHELMTQIEPEDNQQSSLKLENQQNQGSRNHMESNLYQKQNAQNMEFSNVGFGQSNIGNIIIEKDMSKQSSGLNIDKKFANDNSTLYQKSKIMETIQRRNKMIQSFKQQNMFSSSDQQDSPQKAEDVQNNNQKQLEIKSRSEEFRGLGSTNIIRMKQKQIQRDYLKFDNWLIYDFLESYSTKNYNFEQQKKERAKNDKQYNSVAGSSSSIKSEQLKKSNIENRNTNLCKKIKGIHRNFNLAKYYLPITLLKIYLTFFVAGVFPWEPYGAYIILGILNVLYLGYLLIVRPFKMFISHIRCLVVQTLQGCLNGIMCYYCYFSKNGRTQDYNPDTQKIMVMLMIVTAVTATLLIIMESIISWKNEVAIRVLKLMISMRLRGANSITPFTQLRAKSIRIPSQENEELKVKKIRQAQLKVNELIDQMVKQAQVKKLQNKNRLEKQRQKVFYQPKVNNAGKNVFKRKKKVRQQLQAKTIKL